MGALGLSEHDAPGARALRPELLASVYGFGVFFGDAVASLLGLGRSAAARRADWCGRFNLGISLFDFMTDEMNPAARRRLMALPAFAPFSGRRRPVAPTGALEGALDRLAQSVLAELAAAVGRPAGPRPHTLWRAMFRMYEAQLWLPRVSLSRRRHLDRVERALADASAEPFRTMARWVAVDAASSRRVAAAALGRAAGECFFLVDDAKDVWDDLYAGRWNYFLAAAAASSPRLPLARPSVALEVALANEWSRTRIADRAARRATGRLARALARVGAPDGVTERFGRYMTAALGHWYA